MEDVSGFDWDDGNRAKCEKHGVSKEDVETVFSTSPYVYPDLRHSSRENRYHAIGRNQHGRYIFIVFTLRTGAGGNRLIRPISARFMHRKEVERYERR